MVADGEVRGVYRKMHLPNYGVFDERRYFEPGDDPGADRARRRPASGSPSARTSGCPGPPESEEAAAGARLIVNASASPYARGKGDARERMVADRARAGDAIFALCNAVGGQDELVFDGRSVVVAPNGEALARAAQFEPRLLVCDLMVRRRG